MLILSVLAVAVGYLLLTRARNLVLVRTCPAPAPGAHSSWRVEASPGSSGVPGCWSLDLQGSWFHRCARVLVPGSAGLLDSSGPGSDSGDLRQGLWLAGACPTDPTQAQPEATPGSTVGANGGRTWVMVMVTCSVKPRRGTWVCACTCMVCKL